MARRLLTLLGFVVTTQEFSSMVVYFDNTMQTTTTKKIHSVQYQISEKYKLYAMLGVNTTVAAEAVILVGAGWSIYKLLFNTKKEEQT